MRRSPDIMSVDRALEEPVHRQIYGARRFILDGKDLAEHNVASTRSLAEDIGQELVPSVELLQIN
ncbi:MAG: hypothetical protein E5X67_22850 [Mesorhizobium sp.]|uniref:hypothetical protein n=1 Tax=Mesorhizobium sp. TaxID=1871066 RepID=UPI00120446AB|nr:hypothetical protein [Mesorhizobium sp.]TIP25871.1 MAG: hypothetical protein E5X67_22850 [Mesorhizobium sp.]